MKRVEAFVRSELSKNVANAIAGIVDGITLIQSLGRGSGERPMIANRRIEFNSIDVIITIVKDSRLKDVMAAIIEAGHTGKSGDGVIFVTNVEEGTDITTKQNIPE